MSAQRVLRIVAAAVATAGALLIGASPAAAEPDLPPSLDGSCEAYGDIDGYGRIDPAASEGVYLLPEAGTVNYEGRILGREPGERPMEGGVAILLPPGTPSLDLIVIEIGRLPDVPGVADRPGLKLGTWGPEGVGVENRGRRSWDEGLTRWIPPGAIITVAGAHHDPPDVCSGQVRLRIDASPFSAPWLPASLALTALTLVGFVAAGVERRMEPPADTDAHEIHDEELGGPEGPPPAP